MKRFTLMELLVVVGIIGILVSILLPSLAKAREEAKFAVCTSNRGQQYKLIYIGTSDHNERYPVFFAFDGENPENPEYKEDCWAGASQMDYTLKNGVIELYTDAYRSAFRCPSLDQGVIGSGVGSNGSYDYTFPLSLSALQSHKTPSEITWHGRPMMTPLIMEESVEYINGPNRETGFAGSDYITQHHNFGRKGGMTAYDGSSMTLNTNGETYRAWYMFIYGWKNIGYVTSLDEWPR